MRVLLWQEVFWPAIGGAEVMAVKLLLGLRKRGHDCVVVTRRDSPDQAAVDRYLGVPVYRFPFWTVMAERNVDGIARTRREIDALKRAFAPDIVHINTYGPSAFFHVSSSNPHPFLVTLHSDLNLSGRGFCSDLLRSSDRVTACSKALLDFAVRLVPEIAQRASVIYNGVDPPPLEPGPVPLNPPRLLCLGRLAPEKRFDIAIAAFAAIAGRFPEMSLTIAGDGPERLHLEAQTGRLGLGKRVRFLGWAPPETVGGLLNQSTILLMPSKQEAFPLVALEAGLMARPVVAANTGGIPEIVVHGETGILIDDPHPAAFANAVAGLLDQPERAVQLGRSARSLVRRRFNLQMHVDSYETLYGEMASARR